MWTFLAAEDPASLIVPDSVQKANFAKAVEKIANIDYHALLQSLLSESVWILIKILIALADVFTRIYAHTGGKEAISHKEAPEKLKAAFAEVLPEYDRDRVHVSDMKKCFAWYNTLLQAGFTEFKLPAEEEEK